MARQRDYAAEYAARVRRATEAGLSRSAARGHARPTEISASENRLIQERNLNQEQARNYLAMRRSISRARREYTTESDAFKASRVQPKNAIGRLQFMLARLLADPSKLTIETRRIFEDAAKDGAPMRGEIDADTVRYTPERKKGEADKAFTLWRDILDEEPDDAPGYGMYEER